MYIKEIYVHLRIFLYLFLVIFKVIVDEIIPWILILIGVKYPFWVMKNDSMCTLEVKLQTQSEGPPKYRYSMHVPYIVHCTYGHIHKGAIIIRPSIKPSWWSDFEVLRIFIFLKHTYFELFAFFSCPRSVTLRGHQKFLQPNLILIFLLQRYTIVVLKAIYQYVVN
jgi:hypothetical protein